MTQYNDEKLKLELGKIHQQVITELVPSQAAIMPSSSSSASRRLISSGSIFEAQIGYSRAVVDGDFIFVSGSTGLVYPLDLPTLLRLNTYVYRYDYQTQTISPDVAEQAEQCLRNIDTALREAGCAAGVEDVVRVRYILAERTDFVKTWPVLQRWFGEVRPAATMIVAGLMEEVMRIEIEVTARMRKGERE